MPRPSQAPLASPFQMPLPSQAPLASPSPRCFFRKAEKFQRGGLRVQFGPLPIDDSLVKQLSQPSPAVFFVRKTRRGEGEAGKAGEGRGIPARGILGCAGFLRSAHLCVGRRQRRELDARLGRDLEEAGLPVGRVRARRIA